MRLKKGLIVLLIAANLLMLAIGAFTIPPNFKMNEEMEASVPKEEEPSPELPQQEEQFPPAPADSEDIPEKDETRVDLSTMERPDLEDFLWYTEDVYYNGVPTNANSIITMEFLTGSWKALIIYDPNNEYDAGAMEFLNIDLAGADGIVSLTFDWYQIFWANEGESLDETEMEDSVYNGKWEKGGLWASGAGTTHLTQFYELQGKQYAVGTMDTPDGTPAFVALVRP